MGAIMPDENMELEVENQIRETEKKQAGEWAICTSLVFLSAILVLFLCSQYEYTGPPDGPADRVANLAIGSTLTTIFTFQTGNSFPVDVAVIILLISVMSSFCGLISLVADRNNRNTWLMRVWTLGPLLPIFFSIVMIMLIVSNYNDQSILQNIIGTTETIEVNVAGD